MISRERLKGACSESEALSIYHEVRESGDFLAFIRQYMYDADYQVARNSFWALTKATDKELSQLQSILDELIELTMHSENSSVRRLSLNIIERLTIEVEDLRTDFLDFCFLHMQSIEEYPGIQTLCMKLAYRMCSFYPELMDEFLRTIEAMEISYYKPAVKCLQRRILSGKFK